MSSTEKYLYRFGSFQLDPVKRLLQRNGQPVPLTPKAIDLLLVLIEDSETVLSKEELIKRIWVDTAVEENNLTRNISTLRKALGESPNDHRYIVTVPGRGYSFVAPVERLLTNGTASILQTETGSGSKKNGSELSQHDSHVETGADLVTSKPLGLATTTGKKNRWLWVTALIVVLGCGGLLAFKIIDPRSRLHTVNSYRDWEIATLTRTGGSICPDISRDGKYAAYVNREGGRQSVWIQQLATSTQQQLLPPERFFYFDLLFSHDGSELYFVRRESSSPLRSLYRIPVVGGVAKKLRDDLDSQIVLSPDGARLAFARRNSEGKSEFIIADADGVEQRVLADRLLENPAWSPDGTRIAFSVGDSNTGGEEMGIHEIRLSDGAVREVTSRKWQHVSHKVWLADGGGLIVCSKGLEVSVKQLWFVAYPSGETWPLSNNLDSYQHIRLSWDGQMLVAEQLDSVSDIWSARLADTAGAKKIGVWGMSGLCLLAGGQIVYTAPEPRGMSKIWTMSADGADRRQLTFDNGDDRSPVASPDGRFVVFASNRTGLVEIFRMDSDGDNLRQLTHSQGTGAPSVSPDGRWVIYLSSADNNLYRIPIEGGEPQRVAGEGVGASAVSPDGKLIAYFAPGKNAWAIAVSAFKDGSVIRRFEVGSHSLNNRTLKWTPDGKALLYANITDGVGNIWMQPLDGGPAKQVTDFKSEGISCFDVTADGKDVVCARGGWKHDIVLIKNLR